MEKIIIQPDLCDGCMDCQEACAQLHGTSGILVREVEGSFYPIICQQCEDAPCQLICPTDAMTEEGIDETRCIGCGLCMMVCPFGAVVVQERKAHKCDQCPDLDTPACIKACSKRAIAKVDTAKLQAERQRRHIEKITGLGKKSRKSSDLINVMTASTRAKKAVDKEG
ncbi:MAG: 4Fe-4S dicluster domain-containing protein [Methanobacterium sp.]|uniref:Ferredoxin n=1 Tax=Methanobacterium subterraneum TaxID=59277 RepID=A0A2H4VCC2_9EURY|nr:MULTISPECIES: 4Fe-4S dicluster domain-containing protein [Methanobacterium]MBW4258160.1 4Fe-4S dicluster domain-containing protein [Methanobacterium sp. YSL]PKL73099.1 MAG: ferredoxin [Methanobacteriales archaeon HGW-Methanobacteriales-2]AUB55743.1 ferredoxin [Methanobacterium subterraneum]AUB57268.1 ferredoxin [Methanobacterium sp. MZ-A1]MCC7559901.1 4Fe-4S dicluster domain-containing protein [Methanobacterium sp.]